MFISFIDQVYMDFTANAFTLNNEKIWGLNMNWLKAIYLGGEPFRLKQQYAPFFSKTHAQCVNLC